MLATHLRANVPARDATSVRCDLAHDRVRCLRLEPAAVVTGRRCVRQRTDGVRTVGVRRGNELIHRHMPAPSSDLARHHDRLSVGERHVEARRRPRPTVAPVMPLGTEDLLAAVAGLIAATLATPS